MHILPDTLRRHISKLPGNTRWVVALSGGLDSVALLHALAALPDLNSIRAIHVHHGISDKADDWAAFCETLCQKLGVALEVVLVNVNRSGGESLEERAREARYKAFEERLGDGECLLVGHHLDDQMETLLLRLMRGAGPRGMAAIPRTRPLGRGQVLRPLLDLGRAQIQEYGAAHQLEYITDDSNQNTAFDRNYCRLTLLPLVESRWPGYRESWSKTLTLSAEASALLDDLAQADLHSLLVSAKPDSGVSPRPEETGRVLATGPLRRLSEPRQRNVLRYWLRTLGLPEPGWELLRRLTREVLPAREDRAASLILGKDELRRYRDRLYLLPRLRPLEPAYKADWRPLQEPRLNLPQNGYLMLERGGPWRLPEAAVVTVRYRQGGEYCKLAGRAGKPLKKVLQEQAVAPWLRDRTPLLYAGSELACIPGIGVCEGHQAADPEQGVSVCWKAP
ncbi:MAG: tRNA lysidine(34) synthetase TilS [Pseudohongiellaceae bacterium]